jgi:hypothetical protein
MGLRHWHAPLRQVHRRSRGVVSQPGDPQGRDPDPYGFGVGSDCNDGVGAWRWGGCTRPSPRS